MCDGTVERELSKTLIPGSPSSTHMHWASHMKCHAYGHDGSQVPVPCHMKYPVPVDGKPGACVYEMPCLGSDLTLRNARRSPSAHRFDDVTNKARHLIRSHLTPGSMALTYHLSPPLIAPRDAATGRVGKIRVPGWVARPIFRLIASMRYLPAPHTCPLF